MKKVVVIGSNSFSGSDFVDLVLSERDYGVIGISRSAEKSELFLPYLRNPGRHRFSFHMMDLNTNMGAIQELLLAEKPAYVVNFAAQSEVAPSWSHPEQWFLTNGVAIAALTNFLRKQECLERYVHISSPEVYGTCEGSITEDAPQNPSTPYAASKAAGDLMVMTLIKQFAFPAVLIRATNVYGAHQQLHKIIPRTVIYLKASRKIQLHGGGVAVKSFIHIRDVSRGELEAMEHHDTKGLIYHLSPMRGIAVRDVVRQICNLVGVSFDDSTKSVEERPGQDKAYVIDSTRARQELGWSPRVELETGLREVIDWIESYWPQVEREPLEYVHKP